MALILRRSRNAPRGRYTPNLWPVWLVAPLALVVVGALSFGLYHGVYALLSDASAGQTPRKPVNINDVIKTTATVLTLIGAVLAGLYAYRKQLLAEGDARRADASQLADRYTTAAEQLGDDQAAVRLAGVYALARLADDWEEQRQVCIDVLCAYLRMPYEPDPTAPEHRAGEREVRHTIIRVIRDHLQTPDASTAWCRHRLDFTGAVFDSVNFSASHFQGTVTFDGATFSGAEVDFNGATFSGRLVRFDGATFSGAEVTFERATFSGGGQVRFDGAMFSGRTVRFERTTFSGGGQVYFARAMFSGGQVYFTDATFSGGQVRFDGATFSSGQVYFARAMFSGAEVEFTGAMFSGAEVYFTDATFSSGGVYFDSATFSSGEVHFARATFSGGGVQFFGAMFSGAEVYFIGATFSSGQVYFARAMFSSGEVHFARATFSGGTITFVGSTLRGGTVTFVGATFSGTAFDWGPLPVPAGA
ncbi:pentapeptide repeat-containing protein [Streptomyces sp. NBC_00019]|uniref:pentapeptide repeat-containing protein n=1 Tax=Streptomyces sp. NBC_00019 TaxID=2975623 RepID=UPI002F91252D